MEQPKPNKSQSLNHYTLEEMIFLTILNMADIYELLGLQEKSTQRTSDHNRKELFEQNLYGSME